jgi:hypothetical protein
MVFGASDQMGKRPSGAVAEGIPSEVQGVGNLAERGRDCVAREEARTGAGATVVGESAKRHVPRRTQGRSAAASKRAVVLLANQSTAGNRVDRSVALL